jgi:hypothetical protein
MTDVIRLMTIDDALTPEQEMEALGKQYLQIIAAQAVALRAGYDAMYDALTPVKKINCEQQKALLVAHPELIFMIVK